MKLTKLEPKKLLLHVCCACCATEVYNRLIAEYDVTLFWYNPNIEPFFEYKNRLDSFKKLVDDLGCNRIICHSEPPAGGEESQSKNREILRRKAPQDDRIWKLENKKWHQFIEGLENEPEGGKRCAKCFKFRLNKTAQFAKENQFDIFATTLTISPHKNAEIINKIGRTIGDNFEIDFLASDFKKQDGFKKSIDLSHKHNLYRQNYCGCEFSIK